MIIPDYEVGQNVRLKPFQGGADGIRCVCDPDKESGLQAPAITAPELGGCWHGPKTTVLRVFASGDLLLENRHGAVRVARPDEVCR
jgi:hypothetical protein